MANVYIPKTSFAGGEISPEMQGRSDLQKFGTAAKRMSNFYTHPAGSVSNRPGLKYIATAKYGNKKTRLIPFAFSTTQTYILEFGHYYIRFYMNDGQIIMQNAPTWTDATAYVVGDFVTYNEKQYYCIADNTNQLPTTIEYWTEQDIYEIPTPYAHTDLAKLKFTQSADTVFLTHSKHAPMELTRTGHAAWTLTKFSYKNGPFMNQNSTNTTIAASAVTGNGITLTASAAVFNSQHVNSLWQIVHNNDGPATSGKFTAIGISTAIATNNQWRLTTHGIWTGKIRVKISYDGGTTWQILKNFSSNADSNVIDSDTVNQELITNGLLPLLVLECHTFTSGTISYDLTGFTFTTNGIAKITSVTDSTHAVANVVSQIGSTTATTYWHEGAWSTYRGFPSTVAFHENRLWFANTTAQPQTAWSSRVGAYNDFGISATVIDTDAVSASLMSNSVNAIQSLISLNEVLLGMTAAGEWKISADSTSSAITPSTVMVKRQSQIGSSNVDPIIIGNRVLYIQQKGSSVRDIAYNFQTDDYMGTDLTILARHLFENFTITDWAYQQSPDGIIWAVRNDGTLLGFTYLKEQEVWAWHRHKTQGSFQSVATVPGAGYDEPWFVITRKDKDGNNVKFIERMTFRMSSSDDDAQINLEDDVSPDYFSTDPADQFFVDAGSTYNGEPTTEIRGLDYLEGLTVAILADGNVMPQQVVTDGRILLPDFFSKVQVGLPYVCDLELLEVDFQAGDGTISGKKKKVSRIILSLRNSRGCQIGANSDKLYDMKMRENEPWGTPILLFTGQKILPTGAGYSTTGSVFIRQADPLPITILSVVRELDVGGV